MAQGDLNVANQSGAAFRADLNNQLAALGTLQSGASAPSTTFAYMLWADTTTGLLKIRNAANNAWVTIGTMADVNLGLLSQGGGTLTGAVLADDAGTAALPAIAFDGDPDTGIYRKGANQLGLSAGGTERAFLDSNGVTIQAQGDLRLADSDSSNWVALQAPANVATNLTLTVPATDGTADQSLITDGSGALSFASRSRLVSGTAVASTSGTSIDFTNIPSWVKRVTVMFNGVSTNGTSIPQLQIGAGSIVNTGYSVNTGYALDAGASVVASVTTGFILSGAFSAASFLSGTAVLTLMGAGLWNFTVVGTVASLTMVSGGGVIPLSGTLDRVRITTVNGTDAFDAGSINIIYEG